MAKLPVSEAVICSLKEIVKNCEYSQILYPLISLRSVCMRLDLFDEVAEIDKEIVRYLKISLGMNQGGDKNDD